ncbi:MAG: hypothetical protein Q7R65_04665 [bacterium]|nr:hypothetical protein [bacterium]
MNQIELHKRVDILTQSGTITATVATVRKIIDVNEDVRRYFYTQIDESWLDWLWQNSFLDLIKEKAGDPTKYSYRTPELDYLARVIEKVPGKVVDFMLSVPISAAMFNPEVVDRFLWMSSKLPADQSARIVPKIRDDRWVPLMGPFNRWGFEYKQMFETLAGVKDHKSIITLAGAVLSVRSKEDVKKTSFGSVNNPFYFNDLHHSEVFERLSEVDEINVEAALALALKTLGDIVILSGEKEDDVFQYGDMFSLFDVDFFTLTLGRERHLSSRDDVRDLAAIAKSLIGRLVGGSCNNPGQARRLYEKYIAPLPDARSMWRFRLYVWSLCPEVFADELRKAFFRGLKSDKTLWPVTGGAEYEQTLKIAFGILSEPEKQKYIQRAFELFESLDKKHPYGFGIFSSIYDSLSEEDRKRAEELYGQPLNASFSPGPSVGMSSFGTVVPQTPPDSENEWTKPVPDIVQRLKADWTPESLQKKYERQDFLKPINAEGVAGALLANIKDRLPEYVENARLFFDRDTLDAHYTYTFLRGIQEAVRADYKRAAGLDWSPLVELGKEIKDSGATTPFDLTREREKFDAWLAGWTGMLSNLADVIKEILRTEGGKPIVDFTKHRNDLLEIINFLLSCQDPQPANEENKTAKMKSKVPGEDEYQASDPLTTAINTTRGRVFETFIYFVEQDGKKFAKDAESKISKDVRQTYEEALARENTRAITFMFGHYLAFFYYRDHLWMEKDIFPKLFSTDIAKHDLYLAAWEGYLSSSLYDELFKKLHDEYARAIALDPTTYTKRRYRTELDDGLATHIALAYIHFKDFSFESDLYKAFWNTTNTKRWSSFISFIGRSIISRDQPKQWLADHPEVEVGKLGTFWDWALENCNDKESLQEFGFWMQTKDNIFDSVWLADHIDRTLDKTGGDIEWEIGFVDSLPTLAKAAPEKTLSSLRHHLIDGSILTRARGFIRLDSDLIDVFKVLYTNASTREGTRSLINDLLPIGGGQFWGLKTVLEEKD